VRICLLDFEIDLDIRDLCSFCKSVQRRKKNQGFYRGP
jgi:hypothetical protein